METEREAQEIIQEIIQDAYQLGFDMGSVGEDECPFENEELANVWFQGFANGLELFHSLSPTLRKARMAGRRKVDWVRDGF